MNWQSLTQGLSFRPEEINIRVQQGIQEGVEPKLKLKSVTVLACVESLTINAIVPRLCACNLPCKDAEKYRPITIASQQ